MSHQTHKYHLNRTGLTIFGMALLIVALAFQFSLAFAQPITVQLTSPDGESMGTVDVTHDDEGNIELMIDGDFELARTEGFIFVDTGNCDEVESLSGANVLARIRSRDFSRMEEGEGRSAVTEATAFDDLADDDGSALLLVDFQAREILACGVISSDTAAMMAEEAMTEDEMVQDEQMQPQRQDQQRQQTQEAAIAESRREPEDLGVEIGKVLGAPNRAVARGSGDVRWILPGPRALDPEVFGTPQNPLGYIEAVGVPLEQRAVSQDGESYTTTRGPTAHSDQFRPVEGQFEAEVVDITAVASRRTQDTIDATFEFTSPDGEHDYRVVVKRALPSLPNYENFGGVVLNTILHGDTHIGTMLQPEQFSYVAFWGVGEFYVDGEQVADNRLVHLMVTESVRTDEGYALVFDTGLGFNDIHAHLLMPPLEVMPNGPQMSPLPTGFMLPNGQEQPFLHIMYEHLDALRGEVVGGDAETRAETEATPTPEQATPTTEETEEEDAADAMATPEMDETGMADEDAMGDTSAMMGGEQALGGSAQTSLLADVRLMELPDGPLAWVGFRSSAMEPITHQHAPAFVYTSRGAQSLTIQGEEVSVRPQSAAFIPGGVRHTHEAGGRFLEILLMDPEGDPPPGMEDATRVFASQPLEAIPEPPVQARFIAVELPPDSQTSVHTHPGSEFICVTRGDIIYQNAVIGMTTLKSGDCHALPANTAVQKRNPEGATARFLSWFLVEPDEPFAPEASFEEGMEAMSPNEEE